MSETSFQAKNNNTLMYVIGGLLVLALLGALAYTFLGKKDNDDKKNVTTTASSLVNSVANQVSSTVNSVNSVVASTNNSVANNNEYAVGQTINYNDDIDLTVTSVEDYQDPKDYSTPQEGNKFIKVNIVLQNKSKTKTVDYGGDIKIQSPEGNIKDTAIVSDEPIGYGSVAAGGKATGSLYFEVPKNYTGYKLVYEPFSFSATKKVYIKL